MKKFLLFASVLFIWATQLNAQVIIDENFDSYTVGNGAALEAGAPWTTWSAAPGGTEDAIISSTQAASPSNSAYIGATTTDFVAFLGDSTTGVYEISFNYFVETGKMGYFNIMNGFTGGTYLWATDVYVRSSGFLSWTANAVSDSIPFTFDTWYAIAYTIDLDNDTAFMYVNSTLVDSWKFSKGTLGTGTVVKLAAMDFFGATEGGVMPGSYVDDFVFENVTPVGIAENSNVVSIYPNPATDQITIAGQKNTKYEIMNVAGQVILAGNIENAMQNVNISSLDKGVYFVRVTGTNVAVQSFVVE